MFYKYFKYVIRHKFFVWIACWKLAWKYNQRSLYWAGISHDMSKFLPSEFVPYACHFFGPTRNISYSRDKTGYYKPTNTGDLDFDYAWFLHQKRNKHHWQYWICPDAEQNIPVNIPKRYILEMLADWIGAGKAQGNKTHPRDWFNANRDKMILSESTESMIIKFLSEL